jgi:hypothetical protein
LISWHDCRRERNSETVSDRRPLPINMLTLRNRMQADLNQSIFCTFWESAQTMISSYGA